MSKLDIKISPYPCQTKTKKRTNVDAILERIPSLRCVSHPVSMCRMATSLCVSLAIQWPHLWIILCLISIQTADLLNVSLKRLKGCEILLRKRGTMDSDRFSPSDAVPSSFNPLIFDVEAVNQSSVTDSTLLFFFFFRMHFTRAPMNIPEHAVLCHLKGNVSIYQLPTFSVHVLFLRGKNPLVFLCWTGTLKK